jgi:hypothetical protein
MGKSKKKAIAKDVGITKKAYYKISRKTINQTLHELPKLEDIEEYELEDFKSIVNDYDYCDYVFDAENIHRDYKNAEKMRRK